MPLPTAFSNNTSPTGPQLDGDFAAVGALTVIPCTAAGSNTIVMTPNANTPTVTAYTNYGRYSAVAAASNTGATQARIGALSLLNVYRDTPVGPVTLIGGEIMINCAFTLIYDSALNSGAGGFHLVSMANMLPYTGIVANSTLSFVGASTLGTTTLLITGASLSAPTLNATDVGSLAKLQVGTSAASVTRLLSTATTLSYTVTPAQTAQDQNMTLSGVALGDTIQLGYTLAQTNANFGAYVPAAGTVAVRLSNVGSASIAAFSVVMRAAAMGFS